MSWRGCLWDLNTEASENGDCAWDHYSSSCSCSLMQCKMIVKCLMAATVPVRWVLQPHLLENEHRILFLRGIRDERWGEIWEWQFWWLKWVCARGWFTIDCGVVDSQRGIRQADPCGRHRKEITSSSPQQANWHISTLENPETDRFDAGFIL